jgi:hypothetical protein
MPADILTLLATLATLHAQQTELAAQEAAALPAAVRQRLAANAARFAPARAGIARDITLIEAQVKEAVLAHGASVKGERLQAVYVRGKAHWNDDALCGYAVTHAEIVAFRRVGKPSVTLRTVAEKETP